MKTLCKIRWIIISLLVISILLPVSVVTANSPYPPFRMWFRFETEEKPYPTIVSAQLIGCSDEECTKLDQIADFPDMGKSNENDPLDLGWELKCAENRCFVETWTGNADLDYPYFILIASSKTETWSTEVTKFPDCIQCTTSWQVDLSNQPAIVREDPETLEDAKSGSEFILILSLSAIAELLVALFLGLYFRKSQTLSIPKLLGAQFFANLISYPYVWIAIPAFGRLQFDNDRSCAIVSGIAIIVFSCFSVWVTRRWKTGKLTVGIAIFIFIPVYLVMLFMALFSAGYGYGSIQAGGLSPYAIILISELFAVSYETFMIYSLRKGELSFKQIALICVVANAFSCALGLLI